MVSGPDWLPGSAGRERLCPKLCIAMRCSPCLSRITPRVFDPHWPPDSAGREQTAVSCPSDVSRSAAAEGSLRSCIGLELVESFLRHSIDAVTGALSEGWQV